MPLDAALWLASNVGSFGRAPSVELNGVVVAAPAAAPKGLSAFQVELPRLTPNTPYVWKLSYPAPDGQPATAFEVRFTTGSKLRGAPLEARVVGHVEHDVAPGAHPCAILIAAQRCIDTLGERAPRRHELTVTPASALGWIVRSRAGEPTLWPAACGAPQVIVDESEARECFAVQAIGAGGQLGAARDYCTDAKLAPRRKAEPGPAPTGLTPLAPLPPAPSPAPAASPEPPASTPPPAAPAPRAEPASAQGAASGGCSVAALDSPLQSGWVFVLAGLWLRRRRTARA